MNTEGVTTWVLVLAWNGWPDTADCLRSLAPVAGRGHRVLLIDNGSEDGTPVRARSEHPWVETLELGENRGFTGGNNAGIRHALRGGAGAVVLLNNDATAAPDFADQLLAVAAREPRAAAVSSKIYFADRPDVLWFAGGSFSTRTGRVTHDGLGRRDRGQYDRRVSTGRPCGCSMLMTRAALEEVGLLEERLFLYGEEIEWSLRARRAGWRLLFAPGSHVWHKVSRSTGGDGRGRFYYYSVRNVLWTLSWHAPLASAWRSRLRERVVLASFLLGAARSKVPFATAAREIRAGFADYLRGVTGRRPDDETPGSHDGRFGASAGA